MITRPFTVSAAQDWLAELANYPHEWWQSPDNQFDTIRYAEFYKRLLSPMLVERILSLFDKNTNLTRARIEAIFKLSSIDDMRRAVKWKGALPLDRTEEHTPLYPTTGWIGEYLHYSQGSEIPMAWHFWFAVALIGAACRRNIDIDMGTFRVFPYWYLMVIEETASAKSTAFGVSLDMLSRAANKLENTGRVDKVIHIGAQSATLPAFLDSIKSRDFLTILPDGSQLSGRTETAAVLPVDELVSLLGDTKHNPQEWVGFLTDLFGYTRYEWKDSTVTSGSRVLIRPAISFWAGSTMEWIKSSVTDDMFAGGFLGRFIFIKRRGDGKVVPVPPILDPVWAESLADYLVELAKMDTTEFRLTPEAQEWHHEWYHQNKLKCLRFQGDKFQAYFRRKQSHLLRLLMCMSIAEGKFVGDLVTLELANRILEVEEEPMAWIFNDLGSHPEKTLCDHLLKYLEKERIPVLFSKIVKSTRHKLGGSEQTRKLLRTLEIGGEVVCIRGQKGGLLYQATTPNQIPNSTIEGPS